MAQLVVGGRGFEPELMRYIFSGCYSMVRACLRGVALEAPTLTESSCLVCSVLEIAGLVRYA